VNKNSLLFFNHEPQERTKKSTTNHTNQHEPRRISVNYIDYRKKERINFKVFVRRLSVSFTIR